MCSKSAGLRGSGRQLGDLHREAGDPAGHPQDHVCGEAAAGGGPGGVRLRRWTAGSGHTTGCGSAGCGSGDGGAAGGRTGIGGSGRVAPSPLRSSVQKRKRFILHYYKITYVSLLYTHTLLNISNLHNIFVILFYFLCINIYFTTHISHIYLALPFFPCFFFIFFRNLLFKTTLDLHK